jgi:carbon storage regulator
LIPEKEFPMLVFTRNVNEQIVILIPDQAEIVITYTHRERNGKIRLGIEAPREVTVHRREVWERVKARSLSVSRHPMRDNQLTFPLSGS